MTGMAYGMVLAVNIKAAREDLSLSEEDLAERMQNLGYSTWLQQTVSDAEDGEYSLAAEEVLGISVALYVSVATLMLPPGDDPLAVALPSGQIVSLSRHHFEPSLWWYGNTPTSIPQPYEKTRHD
jgi:transcriptional regulator with XRE-family HTH domain